MKKLHRAQFLAELKAAFPEFRDELNSEHGLLHLETAVFRRIAQQAIDEHNESVLRHCFAIAEKYYNYGQTKVRNAMAVSFVEGLNFRDQKVMRSWALPLLPEPLHAVYEVLHADV
jgi:hypothetical protein